MNLVIDDAVEVKQITKTNDKETRKPLGKMGEAVFRCRCPDKLTQ